MRYRFRAADGRPAEGLESVSVETWESLKPGSPFRITYLPEAETSRAEGADGLVSALVMTALGTVFAVVGGAVLATTGTAVWREHRLLGRGRKTSGTILAIEASNVAVNRVRQWRLRYRYHDHLGRAHEGSSGLIPPEAVQGLAVGETVSIRFDPERLERSVWDRRVAAAEGSPAAVSRRHPMQAWRQRAWRTSARWRANFAVLAGAALSVTGMFGIVIVLGPAGIKLLFGAAALYAAVMIVSASVRA